MSPELVGYISIGVLLVLLFLRMWIGLAMAVVGFLGYGYLEGFDMALAVVGTVPFRAVGDEDVENRIVTTKGCCMKCSAFTFST